MHLILTGATGLVGGAVLHHMLSTPSITQISILSRRPVPQAAGHSKAHVIIQTDFNTYPSEILNQLKGAEGVIWAQGISVTQVTKEHVSRNPIPFLPLESMLTYATSREYQRITYDYPLAAAKAFATLNAPAPFKFVYVSGEGATTTPGLFTAHFGVIKGRTEAALLALSKDPAYPNLKPYSLRPGGVDPGAHEEIKEFVPEKKGVKKVGEQMLLPVLNAVYKGMLSPTRELARVLTDLAKGNGEPLEGKGVSGEGRTVSNAGMRRLAGI